MLRALKIESLENRLALAVVAGGDGSQDTTPPSDDPGFANVGVRGSASAVYLGNGWVLTATHVGAGTTVFNGVSYYAVAGSAIQLTNPLGTTFTPLSDLTLYKINGSPALPSLNIEASSPTAGWSVVMIGDGRDRLPAQDYWTSSWAPSSTPSYYTGYTWASSQSVRWGTNTISSIGLPVGVGLNSDFAFATTFTGLTAYDAQATTGDSGGAVFHKDAGGGWSLTGLMASTNQYGSQPSGTSVFGNVTFSADLSVYRNQILSITGINIPPSASAGVPYTINEGASLNLLGLGIDPVGSLSFAWDVNGDNVFTDATGINPTLSWPQLVSLGINDGPGSFSVRMKMTDGLGGVTISSPVTLTVNNVAPTAGVWAPASVQRGATQTITLTANDPSTVDQAAGFTFAVNWGDGSGVQIVNGLSGTQATHKYTSVGLETVSVTATDKDRGQSAAASTNVAVTAVQLSPNAQNPSLTDLVWTGSTGDDQVRFDQISATTIQVTTLEDNGATANYVETFNGVTGRVIAIGQAGNDQLDARGLTTTKATLNGGAGTNVLYGGGAGDLLIGGSNGGSGQQSNNMIVAGNGANIIYGTDVSAQKGETGGNNLIIGGTGNDTIYGNFGPGQISSNNPTGDGGEGGQNVIVGGGGSDVIYASQVNGAEGGHGSLLVGGSTTLSNLALVSVFSEWTSSDSTAQKIADIGGTGNGAGLNGTNYLQPGVTVFNDGAVDQIFSDTTGQANWLLYTFSQDTVSRVKSGDTLTNLN